MDLEPFTDIGGVALPVGVNPPSVGSPTDRPELGLESIEGIPQLARQQSGIVGLIARLIVGSALGTDAHCSCRSRNSKTSTMSTPGKRSNGTPAVGSPETTWLRSRADGHAARRHRSVWRSLG